MGLFTPECTIAFKKKIFRRSLSLPKGKPENLFLDVYSPTRECIQLDLLNPELKRKSAENIALATVGESGVRSMQTFIGQSRWTEIDKEILAGNLDLMGAMEGFVVGDFDGFYAHYGIIQQELA